MQIPSKKCQSCGDIFYKTISSWKKWNEVTKYCSPECAHLHRMDKRKGENHPNWKPKITKHCPICNKEMILAPWESWRKFCSLKCRGLGKRDVNSPVYKGEASSKRLRSRLMDMPEYREWRFQVFKRDNFQCIWCSSKKDIEGDHIKSFALLMRENEIKTREDARKCTNLWNISNGRTLCRKCHRTTDSYLKRV